MSKEKILSVVKYMSLIVLGNLLYSFGIMVFIEPHGLITGGITGFSLFLHYRLGWNLSIIILCFKFFI